MECAGKEDIWEGKGRVWMTKMTEEPEKKVIEIGEICNV